MLELWQLTLSLEVAVELKFGLGLTWEQYEVIRMSLSHYFGNNGRWRRKLIPGSGQVSPWGMLMMN